MLEIFRKQVKPRVEFTWDHLSDVFYRRCKLDDDTVAADLISDATTATETFHQKAETLYSNLRDKYKKAAVESSAKNTLLDAADKAKLKIDNFVNVAEFITSSRYSLARVGAVMRPLFPKRYELQRGVPTEMVLTHLRELEKINLSAQVRRLTTVQKNNSDNNFTIDEFFDEFFAPSLDAMMVPATKLLSQLLHAAATRLADEYFEDMAGALDKRGAPVATQEESERLLLDSKPKLTEVTDYSWRLLQNLDDQRPLYDTTMKRSDATQQAKQAAKREIESLEAVRVDTLLAMARTLSTTLMRVRPVDPAQSPEHEDMPWQQDIRARIHALSEDVSSCYDGNDGIVLQIENVKVPDNIRLDVIALIAEAVSSVTIDLERIKANLEYLESSKGEQKLPYGETLALVQQLAKVVRQLQTSLIRQKEDATRDLSRAGRGSKPYEVAAADKRRREAREFAAEHLNSFKVRQYEEEPEPTPDVAQFGALQSDDSDVQTRHNKQPETQAATRTSAALPSDGGDPADDEIRAISRRLNTLETEALSAHRGDLKYASSVLSMMEDELTKASRKPKSTPDSWFHRLNQAASQCESASAQLRKWANTLKGDAHFLKTEGSNHRDCSKLSQRVAAVSEMTDELLAQLTEKASELSREAKSMQVAHTATMFHHRPILSGYEFLRDNECIDYIVKSREYLTHTRGNDNGVEYLIFLKTPEMLIKLNRAPIEQYSAAGHFHFEGAATEPRAFAFKPREQARSKGKQVRYGWVDDPAKAKELLLEFDEAAKQKASQQ